MSDFGDEPKDIQDSEISGTERHTIKPKYKHVHN